MRDKEELELLFDKRFILEFIISFIKILELREFCKTFINSLIMKMNIFLCIGYDVVNPGEAHLMKCIMGGPRTAPSPLQETLIASFEAF